MKKRLYREIITWKREIRLYKERTTKRRNYIEETI